MIVLKFGGAALRSLEQFQKVATIVAKKREECDRVVVVVSAMGTMTDELLGLAHQIMPKPPKREQDMLVSVGERISMALLAMTLLRDGYQAISFTGSQAGIVTSSEHSEARVIRVKPKRILPHLSEGRIVIVAGFQGVSEEGEITTLGRGGSDTTAVALAVALKAKRVEFYKDVKGFFADDPKLNPNSVHIPKLTYAEAIEIIDRCQKQVIHTRAMRLAQRNQIPLFIRSFEEEGEGSLIGEGGEVSLLEPLYEV